MTTKKRTTSADIIEHFHRLLGPNADKVVLDATKLLSTSNAEQGLLILRQFDCTIGGFGLHSMIPGATIEIPFERELYRPIQYIEMVLKSNAPDNFTRHLTEMACAHVEAILKKSTRLSFLGRIQETYRSVPMGKLLTKAKHLIPLPLYEDLDWLNKIYTFTKHEYGEDAFPDDAPEEATQLFTLSEAIMVYFIARKLVVSLEQPREDHAGRYQ